MAKRAGRSFMVSRGLLECVADGASSEGCLNGHRADEQGGWHPMTRFKHDKGKQAYPLEMKLGKGSHKWCGCGRTKDIPFCDGNCKGGKPVKFELKKKAVVQLCNCGLTSTPPYCDGKSHDKLKKG